MTHYRHDPGCPCCQCPCTNPIEQWNIQYDSDCPCLRGPVALAFVGDVNGCCTWAGTLVCGPTYTTWTLVVCGNSVTLTITDHTGAVLIVFSMTPSAFHCSGPNTLTAVTNNLPCDPPEITIVPSCPVCQVMLKKFVNGLEVWNQNLGNQTAVINGQAGSLLYTPTSIINAIDGVVVAMFRVGTAFDLAGAVGGTDFYFGNAKYDSAGNRVTGWPVDTLPIPLADIVAIAGADADYVCYTAGAGNPYLLSTEDGTSRFHNGFGVPISVPNLTLGGFLQGAVGYRDGFIFLSDGSVYDIDGNLVSHPIASGAVSQFEHPGNGCLGGTDFIALIDENPFSFQKSDGSTTTLTDCPGSGSLGANISFCFGPGGGTIAVGIPSNNAIVGGGCVRLYNWGSGNAAWSADFISPDLSSVGPVWTDGTAVYMGTYTSFSDPYTTKPHCIPAWHPAGCLSSPPPAGNIRGSAGVATEQIAVVVSGATDDECSGCSAVNGTYVLTSIGGNQYSYIGPANSAICSTCDGLADQGTGKFSIKLDADGTLKFAVGSNKGPTLAFGVFDCRDRVDATYLVDPRHPLQLDTGLPNTFFLTSGAGGVHQQCTWPAMVTVTGILA